MISTSIPFRPSQGQADEFLLAQSANVVKVEQDLQQQTMLHAAATEKPLAWSGGEIRVVRPTQLVLPSTFKTWSNHVKYLTSLTLCVKNLPFHFHDFFIALF